MKQKKVIHEIKMDYMKEKEDPKSSMRRVRQGMEEEKEGPGRSKPRQRAD
jgi:hypothetical protein